MQRLYLILGLLIFNVTAYCQIEEDFSNTDLSDWFGDVDQFQINTDFQLQLNADDAGESLIYTQTNFTDSLFWAFDARLNFSPSNNNRLTVLLAVDNVDLSIANGYILELGENGSDDAIELYALNDGSETLIGAGQLGKIATAFDLSLRLEKNKDDLWSLNCGPSGTVNAFELQFENMFSEDIMTTLSFFGFNCQYTSSNTQNFFFDNITVNEITADNDPPFVNAVNVINNKVIEVIFNENVSPNAATLGNFTLTNATIATVAQNVQEPNKISLFLDEGLSSCAENRLSIMNVEDLNANVMVAYDEVLFFLDDPVPGDLRINEILADPITGLFDFIEIINPTDKSFNLQNLMIQNTDKNESEVITAAITLGPGEIIAFTEGKAETESAYNTPASANIFPTNIPSFNISDGNVSLVKTSLLGDIVIDAFDYDNDFHDPAIGTTKGISLERIQLIENTNDAANWSSSTNALGATPGYENAIAEDIIQSVSAQIITEDQIEINFLNTVSQTSALDLSNYALSDGINIMDAELDQNNLKTVTLFLQSPLESGVIYTLTVDGVTTDCNSIFGSRSFELFTIDTPEKGDLLVNEILFDGNDEADDFVEIINTSNKYISLENVSLKNDTRNDNDIKITAAAFIEPNQILAFTEDRASVIDQYDPPTNANILTQKVPVLNRDDGNISLIYKEVFEVVLDAFDYDEDYHFEIISDTKSVSLERISILSDSQDPNNWNSSASINNFATPGYANSLATDSAMISEDVLQFESQVFSPDGDGFKDVLLINYNFDKQGFVGKMAIYDDHGREELLLIDNQTLGTQGIIKWDGSLGNNVLAPVGMYILYYEFFHPDGDVISGKKVCVLAQQLN